MTRVNTLAIFGNPGMLGDPAKFRSMEHRSPHVLPKPTYYPISPVYDMTSPSTSTPLPHNLG